MWMTAAWLSAIFAAGATMIVKKHVKQTDSSVATAIRTVIVLLSAIFMAGISGSLGEIHSVDTRTMLFLVLSGVSAAFSCLAYFRALKNGDADKIMAIEKANILITVLAAIVFFHEREHLPAKLLGMTMIGTGLLLLIRGKGGEPINDKREWMFYAILASVFAALNSLFSKMGVEGIDSNLATVINTLVSLPVAAGFAAFSAWKHPKTCLTVKELRWILLSGMATGGCWLTYYYALKFGPMSAVIPINKMSVPLSILYGYFVLGERMEKNEQAGMTGIVTGMLTLAVFS